LRGQRAPSLTGTRPPRRRRRRGHSLACPRSPPLRGRRGRSLTRPLPLGIDSHGPDTFVPLHHSSSLWPPWQLLGLVWSPGSLAKKIFTRSIIWRMLSKVFSLERSGAFSGKEAQYVPDHRYASFTYGRRVDTRGQPGQTAGRGPLDRAGQA